MVLMRIEALNCSGVGSDILGICQGVGCFNDKFPWESRNTCNSQCLLKLTGSIMDDISLDWCESGH